MKILAVDDDPIILELLQHFINTLSDHDVTTAQSVTEAETCLALADEEFDCFLLDIQMPVTDGITFAQKLRDTESYANTPILMLTAMSEKSYIDRAFEAGATDYITKPFEVNCLRGRLKLVEQIARDAKAQREAVAATEAASANTAGGFDLELHQPFSISDVDGVIENHALENYVLQLSRKSLYGSYVLGFTIRQIAGHYFNLSSADFVYLMTDVSEAISDCLLPSQRLVSYAGNGTFVCVVEGVAQIDMDRLVDQINLHIHQMDLSASDGVPFNIRICGAPPSRLVWRKGEAALETLRDAHLKAEDTAARLDREMGHLWSAEKIA